MQASGMAAVEVSGLCRFFQQGDQVITGLDHVDLRIETGEFLCLSGPSGSGKTTLLNAIGGLDSLNAGEVHIAGQRTDNLSRNQKADLRLARIGFVFQAYNLIAVLSARENVEFIMQLQGIDRQTRKSRALQVLKEVGLAGLENRRPASLSGGQQQRVAVARAIASSPELILADEPTANLDSGSAVQLIELFQALNREHRITFIIATHDERVMRRARRLIRMVDGAIVSDQTQ